jgi:hypothetical protein
MMRSLMTCNPHQLSLGGWEERNMWNYEGEEKRKSVFERKPESNIPLGRRRRGYNDNINVTM